MLVCYSVSQLSFAAAYRNVGSGPISAAFFSAQFNKRLQCCLRPRLKVSEQSNV